MKFSELCSGDRFSSFGSVWTKLDQDTARKHSSESIALGDRGYGYVGDAFCSFEHDREVIFVAPNVK
jgi:hypothetical protein